MKNRSRTNLHIKENEMADKVDNIKDIAPFSSPFWNGSKEKQQERDANIKILTILSLWKDTQMSIPEISEKVELPPCFIVVFLNNIHSESNSKISSPKGHYFYDKDNTFCKDCETSKKCIEAHEPRLKLI